MAPNSSTLAWKIPRTEEPAGLQSMGSLRVGHDRATSLSLFTFTFHFHLLSLFTCMPRPMNPTSQPLGKADLEDLFSEVVSTELGPSLEPQTHRGRKPHGQVFAL